MGVAGLMATGGLFAAARVPSAVAGQPEPPLAGSMMRFEALPEPAPLPDLPLTDLSGASVPRSALRGRLVVLNVWATWCPPCVREMPSLERLQAGYDPASVKVVAVSVDRGGVERVVPFIERYALRALEIYIDPKSLVSRALGVSVMPTTFLLDGLDRLFGTLVGAAEWDAPEAIALLEHYRVQVTDAALPMTERT